MDTKTLAPNAAQKMKFSIKDFSSKCDQIRRKLRLWSHLLKKLLIENFIFCAVKNSMKKLRLVKNTAQRGVCDQKRCIGSCGEILSFNVFLMVSLFNNGDRWKTWERMGRMDSHSNCRHLSQKLLLTIYQFSGPEL